MSKKIEFSYERPEDSVGFLLAQVTMLWQRRLNRVLSPLNLTHTQFVLMAGIAWLSKDNDSVTQIDISNFTNSDRMMVSKVLKTLIEKKFVSRTEHKMDSRAKVIELSGEGFKTLQKAVKKVEEADSEFFSALTINREPFLKNMRKLIEKNSD